MNDLVAALCLALVQLSGTEGQRIDINPAQIVSVRTVRDVPGHFGPQAKCLLHTTDGKIVTVTDDCETVRRKLRDC